MSADGTRFTTYERIEKPELVVVKSHGGQEYFDRDKLRRAIIRSVGKFVPDMQVEEIINRVENNLLKNGTKIPSRKIGEEVLSALFDINKDLDIEKSEIRKALKNQIPKQYLNFFE
jgi:transcriptional repressor NrdR